MIDNRSMNYTLYIGICADGMHQYTSIKTCVDLVGNFATCNYLINKQIY